MLGWHISVYRLADGGTSPATATSANGPRVAVWQTGLGGLKWLDELVKQRKAMDLGGNGYPSHYTSNAKHLLPAILQGPPEAHAVWSSGPGDILTSKWEGKTVVDLEETARCRPDEWLLVEVWDES